MRTVMTKSVITVCTHSGPSEREETPKISFKDMMIRALSIVKIWHTQNVYDVIWSGVITL